MCKSQFNLFALSNSLSAIFLSKVGQKLQNTNKLFSEYEFMYEGNLYKCFYLGISQEDYADFQFWMAYGTIF